MSTQAINPERVLVGWKHAETGTGRKIRKAAERSLTDIAALCHAHPSTVSKWERNLVVPERKYAARWADVLDELQHELKAS